MRLILLLLSFIFLVACGKHSPADAVSQAPAAAPVAASMTQAKMANEAVVADSVGGAEQSLTEISEPANNAAKKYIALRHHLQIESQADKMQAAFDAAIKHCEALNCQLLSANYNKQTPYNPPSASLSLRVPPRNVAIFLSGLAKNGEIMQHGRDSEDKTNQVIDADARIANLTHLRDRLRGMLSDKTAKFKDLIDVETHLANTQSELDSMMSIRKALSFETDLVAVNIDFTASQGITDQGAFAPVARAFKEAASNFMDSIGNVINFMVSTLPWLIVGLPFLWLVRKVWLKLKTKPN